MSENNKYTRLIGVILACAYFWYYAFTYTDWHFLDYVNLIFHEAGHTIFSFLGMYIKIAAGSGLQIFLPLFISVYFFLQHQRISGALSLLWVGQNLLNVSIYARDAEVMQLDLLGGDSVIHDWNYLLSTINALHYTHIIANVLYIGGLIIIFAGTALALSFAFEKKETTIVS